MLLDEKLISAALKERQWIDKFATWADPPSATEEQKTQNALSVIRDALKSSPILSHVNIKIFAQGSYRANTNVKQDSDIDICVCHSNVFYYTLPPNISMLDVGIVPINANFADFKNDVGRQLLMQLPTGNVERGNKSFKIKENSYRIKADVVPAFAYRTYTSRYTYDSGICLMADDGEWAINWPEHTYVNGVQKNKDTGMRYKSAVRIVKRLRNEYESSSHECRDISSFAIECAIYNTPNEYFDEPNTYKMIANILRHIWSCTLLIEQCRDWKEINEKKHMFIIDGNIGNVQKLNTFCWFVMKKIGVLENAQ